MAFVRSVRNYLCPERQKLPLSGASETTFVRSVRNYLCPERQKLPLSGASETTLVRSVRNYLCLERQKLHIRFSWDKLSLAFVDRKPLFAGVVMHMFDC